MRDKQKDLRVRYTKSVLRESMLTKLKEKPVHRITVKELCEAAGINRGTFYSHYTDPIDLYHEMELTLIQELHSVLDAFSETDADYEEIITEIFRYVADNKEQYMLFFHGEFQSAGWCELITLLQNKYFHSWSAKYTRLSDTQTDYLLHFTSNGTIGILNKWAESGMQESPEEMGKLTSDLMMSGLDTFM